MLGQMRSSCREKSWTCSTLPHKQHGDKGTCTDQDERRQRQTLESRSDECEVKEREGEEEAEEEQERLQTNCIRLFKYLFINPNKYWTQRTPVYKRIGARGWLAG